MQAGDASGEGGHHALHPLNHEGEHTGHPSRFPQRNGPARQRAARYAPDAALPPGADVAASPPGIIIRFSSSMSSTGLRVGTSPLTRREAGPPPPIAAPPSPEEDTDPEPLSDTQPREVEVRDLAAARAGRVFPCLQQNRYTGCIGYDRCRVLCWSPRPREREALVRVERPTGGPCRDCIYAREVRGEVAILNGRPVRLMECRLGFWHGRTTVHDFVENKIALNVVLPCPGFVEADAPHPAVEHMREVARRRAQRNRQEKARPDE